MKNKKVIVIGGGFGGLKVTKKLLAKGFEILLISENEHFVFTPLLVEVATSSLGPEDISIRFDEYFSNKNFRFVLGRVSKIDFENKQVLIDKDSYPYHYLVVSAGARKRELNIPGAEYAFPLKNLSHALKIKGALIGKIKSAKEKFRLNVVGAGATGIEFVFAAEQLMKIFSKRTKHIIRLFDTGSILLPAWHKDVRKFVHRRLKKKKIILYSERRVSAITDNAIQAGKDRFASDFTVLAVGTIPNTEMVAKKYLDDRGFIPVLETLQVRGMKNVFAMGDIISFDQLIIPKLAQTATNQARFVASNIVALENGKKLKKYHLILKGKLLSIGAGIAIAQIKGIIIWGRLGHFIRSTVYVMKMPGFNNKINLAKSWILHTLFAKNLKK